MVWKNRLGDCKGKTLLFIGLLNHLKINSYPVLVNTSYKTDIVGLSPTPNRFDHVLAAFDFGGSINYVDLTISNQGGGLNRYVKDYAYHLPIIEGFDGLKAFSLDSPSEPLIEVDESFFISESKNIPNKLQVISTYRLNEADTIRNNIQKTNSDDLHNSYENFYVEKYKAKFKLTKFEYVELDEINGIQVWEEYDIGVLCENCETLSIYPSTIYTGSQSLPANEQNYPISNNMPEWVHHNIHVYNSNKSSDFQFDKEINEKNFYFQAKGSLNGGVQSIYYKIRRKNEIIQSGDLEEYEKNYNDFLKYYSINLSMEPKSDTLEVFYWIFFGCVLLFLICVFLLYRYSQKSYTKGLVYKSISTYKYLLLEFFVTGLGFYKIRRYKVSFVLVSLTFLSALLGLVIELPSNISQMLPSVIFFVKFYLIYCLSKEIQKIEEGEISISSQSGFIKRLRLGFYYLGTLIFPVFLSGFIVETFKLKIVNYDELKKHETVLYYHNDTDIFKDDYRNRYTISEMDLSGRLLPRNRWIVHYQDKAVKYNGQILLKPWELVLNQNKYPKGKSFLVTRDMVERDSKIKLFEKKVISH